MPAELAETPADRFDQYRAVRAFRLFLRAADRLAEHVIMAMMAVMLAIVTSQVFMRYVMKRSLDWADETATLLFVWTVFLALPLALRNGGAYRHGDAAFGHLQGSSRPALPLHGHPVGRMLAVVAWEAFKLTTTTGTRRSRR